MKVAASCGMNVEQYASQAGQIRNNCTSDNQFCCAIAGSYVDRGEETVGWSRDLRGRRGTAGQRDSEGHCLQRFEEAVVGLGGFECFDLTGQCG